MPWLRHWPTNLPVRAIGLVAVVACVQTCICGMTAMPPFATALVDDGSNYWHAVHLDMPSAMPMAAMCVRRPTCGSSWLQSRGGTAAHPSSRPAVCACVHACTPASGQACRRARVCVCGCMRAWVCVGARVRGCVWVRARVGDPPYELKRRKGATP